MASSIPAHLLPASPNPRYPASLSRRPPHPLPIKPTSTSTLPSGPSRPKSTPVLRSKPSSSSLPIKPVKGTRPSTKSTSTQILVAEKTKRISLVETTVGNLPPKPAPTTSGLPKKPSLAVTSAAEDKRPSKVKSSPSLGTLSGAGKEETKTPRRRRKGKQSTVDLGLAAAAGLPQKPTFETLEEPIVPQAIQTTERPRPIVANKPSLSKLSGAAKPFTPVSTPRSPQQFHSFNDLLPHPRIHTPPAPVRKIRSTLPDSPEDRKQGELKALYGTFGLSYTDQKGRRIHQLKNVTEPSVPLVSSEGLLRSIALQRRGSADEPDGIAISRLNNQQEEAWWGLSDFVGKAVRAFSPPTTSNMPNLGQALAAMPAQAAPVSPAMKRARSHFDMAKHHLAKIDWTDIRDSPPPDDDDVRIRETTPVDQEQIAPPRDGEQSGETTLATISGVMAVIESKVFPPPQTHTFASPDPEPVTAERFEDFGYSPLPDDYEVQSEGDAAMSDTVSLGSSGGDLMSRTDSAGLTSIESIDNEKAEEMSLVDGQFDAVMEVQDEAVMYGNVRPGLIGLGFRNVTAKLAGANDDLGKRIMEGAVSLDDMEDDDEPPAEENSSGTIRLPTFSPEAEERVAEYKPTVEVGSEPSSVKSERTLHKAQSLWLYSASRPAWSDFPSTSRPAPIAISAAMPALPQVVTSSPVMCDSASSGSVDLPPLPSPPLERKEETTTVVGSLMLRGKKSLKYLRDLAFAPAPPLPSPSMEQEDKEDGIPVLTTRPDWSASANVGGWSSHVPPERIPGQRSATGATIDYSKSFFYRPTPTDAAPSAASPPRQPRKSRSLKSLRANLLIPVAPVPAIPAHLRGPLSAPLGTTPKRSTSGTSSRSRGPTPPRLAISSPRTTERGLPPRELVLEGEEWDGRDVIVWDGRGLGKKAVRSGSSGGKVRRRRSKKEVADV